MQGMDTIGLRHLQARELIDPRGASHDGTSDLLTTLERHYSILHNRRATIASLMQESPHDGRPPIVSAGHRAQGTGMTNGQETRVSERWSATPIERLTDWQGNPLDMQCRTITVDPDTLPAYGISRSIELAEAATGGWQPFSPAARQEHTQSRAATTASGGQTYADRLAALGADLSLAGGDA